MKRRSFIGSTIGAAVTVSAPLAAIASPVFARLITQANLVQEAAVPNAGQWVRLIMGAGVDYQKQIGAVAEPTEHGNILFYETQVGTPGGSCNPNTMKRTYLNSPRFAPLLSPAPVLADVSNSGTLLTRWSDAGGGQTQESRDKSLHLFDATYLYDDRPLQIVSNKTDVIGLPQSQAYGGSGESDRGPLGPHSVMHTVAKFDPPYDAKHKLIGVEVWTTPRVPFGIAKYRATATDLEPFEMHVFSYGTHFKSDLPMSLKTIRLLTPDGSYVQTS